MIVEDFIPVDGAHKIFSQKLQKIRKTLYFVILKGIPSIQVWVLKYIEFVTGYLL